MLKKKSSEAIFDDLIEGFIKKHELVTRKDLLLLMEKISQLEFLLKQIYLSGKRSELDLGKMESPDSKKYISFSASELVLDFIRKEKRAVSFKEISDKMGYEDKKLRNIIFRLSRSGKIERKKRGFYQYSS